MQGNKGSEVQRVLTPPCEIAVQLIIDAVPQICLLEQGSLRWARLPLREERRQGCSVNSPEPQLIHHEQIPITKPLLVFVLGIRGCSLLLILNGLVQEFRAYRVSLYEGLDRFFVAPALSDKGPPWGILLGEFVQHLVVIAGVCVSERRISKLIQRSTAV